MYSISLVITRMILISAVRIPRCGPSGRPGSHVVATSPMKGAGGPGYRWAAEVHCAPLQVTLHINKVLENWGMTFVRYGWAFKEISTYEFDRYEAPSGSLSFYLLSAQCILRTWKPIINLHFTRRLFYAKSRINNKGKSRKQLSLWRIQNQ